MLASDAYCCSVCKEVVLQLESGHSLEELPRRRRVADTIAVHEARSLRRLRVSRAPRMLVRIGEDAAEWRYPFRCPGCFVPLGYRAAPLGEPSERLYLHAGAVQLLRRASSDDGDGAAGSGPERREGRAPPAPAADTPAAADMGAKRLRQGPHSEREPPEVG